MDQPVASPLIPTAQKMLGISNTSFLLCPCESYFHSSFDSPILLSSCSHGTYFFFLSTRLLNGAYWTSTTVNNHCLCTQAWRREPRGPLKDKQSRENIYDRLLNYKWWLKTLSMWQQTNQGLKSTQNCDDHQILIPHTGTTLGGSATIYFLRFRLARGQSTF